MQKTGFTKLLAKLWEIDITEPLIRRNGQLECSAFQMIDENLKVVGLNVGVLGRVTEEVVRMLHDELIERGRRRDEDRTRASRSSSGAACPLPGRSNRTGIAGHHARNECTLVDPKFQC